MKIDDELAGKRPALYKTKESIYYTIITIIIEQPMADGP